MYDVHGSTLYIMAIKKTPLRNRNVLGVTSFLYNRSRTSGMFVTVNELSCEELDMRKKISKKLRIDYVSFF